MARIQGPSRVVRIEMTRRELENRAILLIDRKVGDRCWQARAWVSDRVVMYFVRRLVKAEVELEERKMSATYEIESARRVVDLLRELGKSRDTDEKLEIAAELLAEAGVIHDTPEAKAIWRRQ